MLKYNSTFHHGRGMAGPKKHAAFTGVILALYATFSIIGIATALWHYFLIGLCIIITGILIDIDHLIDPFSRKFFSRRFIILIRKKRLITQEAGWTNRFHTWYGALVVLFFFYLATKSWWPFAAYLLHIVIDACNKANNEAPLESPLSEWLYCKVVKKYFKKLLYYYNPGK